MMELSTKNDLEARAVDRVLAIFKSARKRAKWSSATRGGDLEAFHGMLFEEDLDAVYDGFDDDADEVDSFVEKLLENKQLKKLFAPSSGSTPPKA